MAEVSFFSQRTKRKCIYATLSILLCLGVAPLQAQTPPSPVTAPALVIHDAVNSHIYTGITNTKASAYTNVRAQIILPASGDFIVMRSNDFRIAVSGTTGMIQKKTTTTSNVLAFPTVAEITTLTVSSPYIEGGNLLRMSTHMEIEIKRPAGYVLPSLQNLFVEVMSQLRYRLHSHDTNLEDATVRLTFDDGSDSHTVDVVLRFNPRLNNEAGETSPPTVPLGTREASCTFPAYEIADLLGTPGWLGLSLDHDHRTGSEITLAVIDTLNSEVSDGTWQYRRNSGWVSVNGLNDAHSFFVLKPTDSLRYQTGSTAGTSTLKFKLFDKTIAGYTYNTLLLSSGDAQYIYTSRAESTIISTTTSHNLVSLGAGTHKISITENDFNPPGIQAPDLRSIVGVVNACVPPPSPLIYAVLEVHATATQGTWQYISDTQTTWATLTLGTNQFLRVSGNTKLRFVPEQDYFNNYAAAPTPLPSLLITPLTSAAPVGDLHTIPTNRGPGQYMHDVDVSVIAEVTGVNAAPTLNLRSYAYNGAPNVNATYHGSQGTLPAVYVDHDNLLDGLYTSDSEGTVALYIPFSGLIHNFSPGLNEETIQRVQLSISSVLAVKNFKYATQRLIAHFFDTSTPQHDRFQLVTRTTGHSTTQIPSLRTADMTQPNWHNYYLKLVLKQDVAGVIYIKIRATDDGAPIGSSSALHTEKGMYVVLRDGASPGIKTLDPSYGSTTASGDVTLTLTFKEPITKHNSKSIALFVGTLQLYQQNLGESNVSLAADHITLSIDLTGRANLPKSEHISVRIPDGAFSDRVASTETGGVTGITAHTYQANKPGIGIGSSTSATWWLFTTPAEPTVPPRIIRSSPQNGALNAGLSAHQIRLIFDEAVSILNSTVHITVRDLSVSPPAVLEQIYTGGLSISSGSSTEVLVNNTAFLPNKHIQVSVPAGMFQNAHGTSSAAHTMSFRTVQVATFQPTLSTPAANATNIPSGQGTGATTGLVAAYSGTILKGSAGAILFKARKAGSTNSYIQIARIDITSSLISLSSTGQHLDIGLSYPYLSGNTQYTIEIEAGAVLGAANTPLAAHRWAFSTATEASTATTEVTAPRVVPESLVPSRGATGVSASTTLQFKMTEPIEKGTGHIHIYIQYTATSSELYRSIPVSASSVAVSGATVQIACDNSDGSHGTRTNAAGYDDPLPGSHSYYVLIDPGAFVDFSAQNSEAISAATYWPFTIAATDDTKSPSFEAVKVIHESSSYTTTDPMHPTRIVNVPIEQPSLQITFDEPIQKGTGNITLSDGTNTATLAISSAEVSVNLRTAIIELPTLRYSTVYTYTIAAENFEDLTNRDLGSQIQRSFETVLEGPQFSSHEVVRALSDATYFTLSGGNYQAVTAHPFTLSSTGYSALKWYSSPTDAASESNEIYSGANPEYKDLINGLSSNTLSAPNHIGIYPFWVKQTGTRPSAVSKVRLIVLTKDVITMKRTVGGVTVVESNTGVLSLYAVPSLTTYELEFAYNDAATSGYEVSWSSPAGGLSFSDTPPPVDGHTRVPFLPLGISLPAGATSRDVVVTLTLIKGSGSASEERYSLSRTLRIVADVSFSIEINDGSTHTAISEVCQNSGTHSFEASSYTVSDFYELSSNVSGLLVGTQQTSDWKINTNVALTVPVSLPLTITRKLGATGAISGGHALITMYEAPQLSFPSVEERYCTHASAEDLEIRIANSDPGSTRTRMSNTSTANLALYGELNIYVRLPSQSNFPTTANETISGTGLHTFQLDPGTIFSTYTSAPRPDSIFVKLAYTSVGTEDVGTNSCTSSAEKEFIIYQNPLAPRVNYRNNQLYCQGDPVAEVRIHPIVRGNTYRWYTSTENVANHTPDNVPAPATTHTPSIDTSLPGRSNYYVSAVRYIQTNFRGCESNTRELTFSIQARPAADIAFIPPNGACIGTQVAVSDTRVRTGNYNMRYEINDIINHSDTDVVARHTALYVDPSKISQTNSSDPVTIKTDHVIDTLDANVRAADRSTWTTFSSRSVDINYYYVEILSDGGSCAAIPVTKSLTIHPLPRVSIADFGPKHCNDNDNKPLLVKINGYPYAWKPVSANRLGTMELLKSDGNIDLHGNYIFNTSLAGFYTSEGKFIFSSQTGDLRPIFRLRYTSHSSQVHSGCVSMDSIAFTIYPRPSPPAVTHASGATEDSYCQGATAINPIAVASPAAATTYRWYNLVSGAVGPPSTLKPTGAPLAEGTSYTPLVNTNTLGTHNYYLTQVSYVTPSFRGCESFASVATIKVGAPESIDFRFDVGIAEGLTQACIADGSGVGTVVNLVPLSPVAATQALETGRSLTFNFVHADASKQSTLNGLINSNRTQTGGSGVVVDEASFPVWGAVSTLTTVSDVSENFTALTLQLSLRSVSTFGVATCSNTVSKSITVYPLPRVSIEGFAKKHCRNASPVSLGPRVDATSVVWSSSNPNTGVFGLEWKDNMDVYHNVPNFYSSSRLSFSEIFTNNAALSSLVPSENEDFRLIYSSHASLVGTGCVNRDTVNFIIYPRPRPPTVTHAFGGSEDNYCQGTAIRAVTASSTDTNATYNWYDEAVESPAGSGIFEPSSTRVMATGATYRPQPFAMGTNLDYVAQVRYKATGFGGCESAVATVTVVITPKPTVDFRFDVGTETDVSQVCVANASGVAQTINMVPLSPVVVGEDLGTNRLKFEALATETEIQTLIHGKMSSTEQTGTSAAAVTVSALDAVKGLTADIDPVSRALSYNVNTVGDDFARTSFDVRLTYTKDLGAGVCEGKIEETLFINPLPRVSVGDFQKKYCEGRVPVDLWARVGARRRDWDSSDANTGVFSLSWKDAAQVYHNVPNFHEHSQLDFAEILTNNAALSSLGPSESEDFRLIYTSHTSHVITGCVNTDTVDFIIYPRPAVPVVRYASGGSQDEYCVSTSTSAIANVSIATPPAGASYRWYREATGTVGALLGSDFVTSNDGTGYRPRVETTTPGIYSNYVTALRYAASDPGGFVGCESFARSVNVRIYARPSVDFRFDVGAAEGITETCVADASGAAQVISLVPDVSGIGSTDQLVFEAVSDTERQTAMHTSIWSDRTQTGTAASATISALMAARALTATIKGDGTLAYSVNTVEDNFSAANFRVRLKYKQSLAGGNLCENNVEKAMTIHPLPRVSMVNFKNMYCQGTAPMDIRVSVGTRTAETWNSGDSDTGTLRVEWKDNMDIYHNVPNFHASTSSQLNFSIILEHNNGLKAMGLAPSAEKNFRLIYQSDENRSPTGCVNRVVTDFSIILSPVAPTLHASSAVYCEQSSVSLAPARVQPSVSGLVYRWYNSADILQGTGVEFLPAGLSLATDIAGDDIAKYTYYVVAISESSDSFEGCKSQKTDIDITLVGKPTLYLRSIRDPGYPSAPYSNLDDVVPVCIARVQGSDNDYLLQKASLEFIVGKRRFRTNPESGGIFEGPGVMNSPLDPSNPNEQRAIFDPLAAVQKIMPSIRSMDDLQDQTVDVSISYIYKNHYKGLDCPSTITRTLRVKGAPTLNFSAADVLELDENEVAVCVNQSTFTLVSSSLSGVLQNPSFFIDGSSIQASTYDIVPEQLRRVRIGNNSTYKYAATSIHRITLTAERDKCSNFVTKTIYIKPVPQADFDVNFSCTSGEARLRATVDNISHLSAPIRYNWRITETSGAVFKVSDPAQQEIKVHFREGRAYNVSLLVQDLGCETEVLRSTTSVFTPVPVLAWKHVVAGRPTIFQFYESKLPLGDISRVKFSITKDNNALEGVGFERSNAVTLFRDMQHTFTEPGIYEATFQVISSSGCAKGVTQAVNILPHLVINKGDPYKEDFSSNKGFWYTDTLSFSYRPIDATKPEERAKPQAIEVINRPTSWAWGTPKNGSTFITTPAGGKGKSWLTNAHASFLRHGKTGFLRNEKSYLYTPEFDMSQVVRPMVQFDLIYNFDNRRCGAALQYSSDRGKTWYTLGNYKAGEGATGIHWYNYDLITANPGEQHQISGLRNTHNVGWADSTLTRTWEQARHRLEEIPLEERNRVRFRFALAATDEEVRREGIGIDNFWIGSRDKVVLIEEFSTELMQNSKEMHEKITNMLSTDNEVDAVRIAYYTNPHQATTLRDRLYMVNPEDVNARQIFYGVMDVPSSVIDGDYSQNVDKNNLLGWTKNTLSRAALQNPLAHVKFKSIAVKDAEISVELSINLTDEGQNQHISGTHHVHVIMIEKVVHLDGNGRNGQVEFLDVMRKMFPTPTGMPVVFDGGPQEIILSTSWKLIDIYMQDMPMQDLDLHVVAFVQNPQTKQVYQAATHRITPQKVLSLGTENLNFDKDIKIYPNPVQNQSLELRLKMPLSKHLQWQIWDYTGKVKAQGLLPQGTQAYHFHLGGYSDGFYYLILQDNAKVVASRKLLIHNK